MSTQTQDTFFPKNTIVLIIGNICPIGWSLCDGSSGTPNLTGRSPFGINGGLSGGLDKNLGDTGDSLNHTHTESHKHTASTILYHNNTVGLAQPGSVTHAYPHNHNVVMTTNSSPTGDLSIESNLLPYYAVNYCIKVVN